MGGCCERVGPYNAQCRVEGVPIGSVTVSVTFFPQTLHILRNQMQCANYTEFPSRSSVSLFDKEFVLLSFSGTEGFCKQPVGGSIPLASSMFFRNYSAPYCHSECNEESVPSPPPPSLSEMLRLRLSMTTGHATNCLIYCKKHEGWKKGSVSLPMNHDHLSFQK